MPDESYPLDPDHASLVRDDAEAALRGALGEDSLQRAPMHVEPPRRLRDIAVAKLIDALNVLPAHPVGRHRILRWRCLGISRCDQRLIDIVGVGGLSEIIDGAELH